MDKNLRYKIKKSTHRTIWVALLVMLWHPAQAELELSGTYAGLMFSDSTDKFSSSAGDVKENRGHFKGKFGWIMSDLLDLETHFGITTNSKTSQGIMTYGAYARLGQDFDQYKLYGLLGLGGIYAYEDGVDNLSESSGSFGAGLEIFGSKDIAITLEYVRVLDTSVNGGDLTFDTFGFGFTYYFTEDTSYFNKNRNKIKSIRY